MRNGSITVNLPSRLVPIGVTQLMSFRVGADDSLPEKTSFGKGVKTTPAGGLAAAPTSNCVTPKSHVVTFGLAGYNCTSSTHSAAKAKTALRASGVKVG